MCTVLKVERCILSSFRVQDENQTFAKVEGPKVDFFLSERSAGPCVTERNAAEAHVVHRLAVMVCGLGPGRTATWAGGL